MLRPLLGLILLTSPVAAAEVAPPPRAIEPPMPLTRLAPAKLVENLCVYHYPVSTRSPECQAFCDQAFGYYYSYVWMEAARCFETALRHDPECASAWLGLHRALDKWGKGTLVPKPEPLLAAVGGASRARLPERFSRSPRDYALDRARELMPRANHREQLLIQSRLQEKGMWPGVKPDERKKKAQASLDELLTLYDDDQEGWFWRAQIADGPNAKAPIFKALLRLNPLHPGANHELVHFFENIKRPALGWPYAEGYMKSSPAIPHAFHMQAHLAMRVGKWQHTTDWSWKAIELEKAYHQFLNVKPADDHQFFHHLETLTRSLVHDGRFAQARQIQAEARGYNYHFRPEWFRMAVAEQDWAAAREVIDHYRKRDRQLAAYFAAVVALEQGDHARAAAEVDVLRQANQSKKKDNRTNQLRLWEVQGRLLCQTGQGDAGLKLLRRVIEKTKDDYSHHAWGGGAYYMETWGVAALEAGNAAEADEAFQEALAHDAGSVRAALGLWALCSRLDRPDQAARYLKVARRCWSRANPADFERLRDQLAHKALNVPASGIAISQ